ncbi:hypothetical protein D3C76_816690 [compost metagenome]
MTISSGICEASIPERSQISVRVTPGNTAWTLTPVPSSSAFSDWVRLNTYALLALYVALKRSGNNATTDAMLMIVPRPALAKPAAAADAKRVTAVTFN